jgi:hypothetical protein
VSYHPQHRPRARRAFTRLPRYPLALAAPDALAPVAPPSTGLTRSEVVRKVLIVLAVLVLLFLLLRWLSNKDKVRENRGRRVQKMSTSEMAGRLKARLERRGGVSATTMQSLAQLSRRRESSGDEDA